MALIDAVLLDLDSTILDNSRFAESIAATCERISAAHRPLDAAMLMTSNARVWKEHGQRLTEEWTIGVRDGASVATESWRLTLATCGCVDESVVRFAAETHLREEPKTYRLFDDVLPLIEFFRSLRIPLGLVSNGGSDSQRRKLRTLDALDWFDTVVVSAEVGIAKPDPQIFQIALEKLSATPQNTWHVGDTLSTDVAGARAASIKAAWLNRSRRGLKTNEPRPDLEVSSLTDFVSVLTGSQQ